MSQRGILLIIAVCSMMAFSSSSFGKKAGPSSSTWSDQMKKTGQAFAKVFPYIYDESKFDDPKNKTALEERLINFSQSIHKISEKKARQILGDDPYVVINLQDIKSKSVAALDFFRRGKLRYSRDLLKSTSSSCFNCHTRLPRGATANFWNAFKIDQDGLTPVEKTYLFIGIRDFEKAKNFIRQQLQRKKSKNTLYVEDEKLIRLYLFISVRGSNSLKDALNFLTAQGGSTGFSSNFKSNMILWEKDLQYWIDNTKKTNLAKSSLSDILKVSDSQIQSIEDSDFIKQLIAAKNLHLQLSQKLSKLEKSKNYLYLGQIYRRLLEAGLWDLPETYYEACIRTSPKTATAQKCYDLYKQSLIIGYSGSRGTDIPGFAQKKMNTLEKLASTK